MGEGPSKVVVGIDAESEQRYRRLFDRHRAYCRRRTDAATASDASAETFAVAWRRLEDVPDGDAALGWLYGTARRVLANEFRSSRRRRGLLRRLGECRVFCVRGGVCDVVSFLLDGGLGGEGDFSGEVDGELVEGSGPVFDRVGPFLLSVA